MANDIVRPHGARSVVHERVGANGVSVRVVFGWRRTQISVVLDAVVSGEQEGFFPEAGESPAAAARRLGVSKSTMHGRMHPEKTSARNKRTSRAWRESVVRPQWEDYCAAYRVKFPGSSPVGFGRWIADGWRARWLADGKESLVENTRSLSSARKDLERASSEPERTR